MTFHWIQSSPSQPGGGAWAARRSAAQPWHAKLIILVAKSGGLPACGAMVGGVHRGQAALRDGLCILAGAVAKPFDPKGGRRVWLSLDPAHRIAAR